MLLTSSNLPFHINSHNAAVAQNPFLCCLRGCLKHSSREGREGNVGTRQAGSLPPCYGLCTPPELCHARLPQHTRPACKLRAALHNGIQGSSTHHRVWEIHLDKPAENRCFRCSRVSAAHARRGFEHACQGRRAGDQQC